MVPCIPRRDFLKNGDKAPIPKRYINGNWRQHLANSDVVLQNACTAVQQWTKGTPAPSTLGADSFLQLARQRDWLSLAQTLLLAIEVVCCCSWPCWRPCLDTLWQQSTLLRMDALPTTYFKARRRRSRQCWLGRCLATLWWLAQTLIFKQGSLRQKLCCAKRSKLLGPYALPILGINPMQAYVAATEWLIQQMQWPLQTWPDNEACIYWLSAPIPHEHNSVTLAQDRNYCGFAILNRCDPLTNVCGMDRFLEHVKEARTKPTSAKGTMMLGVSLGKVAMIFLGINRVSICKSFERLAIRLWRPDVNISCNPDRTVQSHRRGTKGTRHRPFAWWRRQQAQTGSRHHPSGLNNLSQSKQGVEGFVRQPPLFLNVLEHYNSTCCMSLGINVGIKAFGEPHACSFENLNGDCFVSRTGV